MYECGVFSGPYFPVFSPDTGKYGPEKTPYLDNFHAVSDKTRNKGFPRNCLFLVISC